MVEYIKQLIQSIEQKRNSVLPGGVFKILGNSGPPTYQLLRGLSEELDRLDPRDFEPAARHDFVVARIAVSLDAFNVSPDPRTVGNLISPLPKLLDAYGGQGS